MIRPGHKLHIDFETYCEVNIKTAGAHRYVEDDSFEPLCLAWAIDNREPQLWLPTQGKFPVELIHAIESGYELNAYNAQFERLILNKFYKEFGLQRQPPVEHYNDVMALTASFSLPFALEKAAEALELPTDQQKDKRGKFLINKLCKPKKWSRATPFTRWTPERAPELFQELYDYCIQDVVTERAVLYSLPFQQLTPTEKQIWNHTVKQNDRGLYIDIDLVDSILEVLDQYVEEQEQVLSNITDGRITTGSQRDRILNFCREHDYVLPDLTAATVSKALNDSNCPDLVHKVLQIRSNLSKTSTAKFKKIKIQICKDQTVKGNLFYWGTITGRYGGRGFQMHNLPRRKEKDPTDLINAFMTEDLGEVKKFGEEVMENASKLIRSVIIPPPGFELIVSDYSSIENRALHASAYDEETIDEFKRGLDQYKTFAQELFHVPYTEITSEQRFRGKTAILGLGYMMGAKTYQATAAGYGINLTEEQAKHDVNVYRTKYPKVRSLWYKLYEAAMRTVKTGLVSKYNGIKFGIIKDRLFMKLPSSRMICYTKPRTEWRTMPWGQKKEVITFMGVNPYNKKWMRLAISPGRLTENLIQGLTRDILVQGALNAEKNGYKIIGSVHDETLAIVPKGTADQERFDKLLCTMPKWCDHIPITAKGYTGFRYKKD